jgi:acetyl esterase/lipase
VPVVASYGGEDPSLRGAAAELEGVLTGLGVEHDVREYPGAGHSFLNRETGVVPHVMQGHGAGRLPRAVRGGRVAADPGVVRPPPARPGGPADPGGPPYRG